MIEGPPVASTRKSEFEYVASRGNGAGYVKQGSNSEP